MSSDEVTFEMIMERIGELVTRRDDVVSVGVFGSRARVSRPADKWSDLDLLLFVTAPDAWLQDRDWIQSIGECLIDFYEPAVFGAGIEIRVLFQGFLDVDFLLFPVREIDRILGRAEVSDWLRSGSYALADKDGRLTERIHACSRQSDALKSAPLTVDLCNLTADFFFHVVWAAKKLMRGETLVAKNCCDTYMKKLLLRLLAINQRAKDGTCDVPAEEARFFEQWAGEDIASRFLSIYATYNKQDIMRSIAATAELFSEVAKETGKLLGQEYPFRFENNAMMFLESHR
ncbi:MAG: aminoglycoside 6-adenylyltransferase [Spirochaetales bacterium]|nr:aminoglycoside 6-adenylyltransferase [Spirochaetales bacterium]